MGNILNSLSADQNQEIDIDQILTDVKTKFEEISGKTRITTSQGCSYNCYRPQYRIVIDPSWNGHLTRPAIKYVEGDNSIYRCGR